MAYTAQVTVNSSGDTAIIANSFCKIIVVKENPGVVGWPTTDFLVKKGGSSTYIRITAGSAYTFQSGPSFYKLGQTVGYLKAVTGSTTFDQDEDEP